MFDDPLLIFDCDGVLIDSEAIYLQVELAFLAAKGVEVAADWYVTTFMALAPDKWRAKLSALLEEHTGAPLTEDDYVALKSEARRRVIEEVRPIEGIEALLGRMQAARCVASSTQMPFLPLKLQRAGLAGHFGDNVFSGDMVAEGKPAPDLFLYAANRMAYPSSRCITVEDSANGVRGAKAAGQFVIGFLGGGHWKGSDGAVLTAAGADMLVRSHAELGEWLSDHTGALRA